MHNLTLINYSKDKKVFENINFKNKNININDGDILKTTVIEKKDNNIILETKDNIKFKTNIKNNIENNINIGDIINFKVIKNKNNINLKFINKISNLPNIKNNKYIPIKDTMVLFKNSNFIKKTDSYLANNNNDKKNITISKLQNKLKYIKNNINLSIVNELLSNGISFKDIDLNMLNCVLHEVKIKDINISNKNYISNKDYIVDSLNINKLPLTSENINYINKSLKTFENIKNIDNNCISYILKNNKEIINLKDLYISKYSSNSLNNTNKNISTTENKFNLDLEIENFLLKKEIDINKNNINISKFLIENNIPVTKNNIYTTHFLQNINNYIDSKDIIQSSVYNLKINKNSDDINLYNKTENISLKELKNNYKNILNNLQKISFKEIVFLEKNKLPINLNNLQNCLDNNINNFKKNEINNNTIKNNLNLLEIQLKLTSEASYKLVNKNIKIDTIPLKKVVEELRNLEKNYYKNILEYKNIDLNKNNIDKMYNTFSNISTFTNLPYNIYNKLFNNNLYPSIKNINNSILSEKIIEQYNLFTSSPNKKYGDSLKNLNNQINLLLKNLNIETNINNIKSAKILFKNDIDINYENIIKINIINEKLNNIKEKFHPFIAANMIKDGVNPLNIHIDQILEYINKFNNKYENNINNKLYENILQLNKLDNISLKEKDSIIAIYKMMHYIEKNNFAPLGTNIISRHNLTLGNLLDAAKYYNKTKNKITYEDITIDDNFIPKKVTSKNIKKLLNETCTENLENNSKEKENNSNFLDNITYNKLLISSLKEKLDINKFEKLIKNNKNIFNKHISDILEEIKNDFYKDNINIQDNTISNIKNILNTDIKTLYFMEKNNISLTYYNIEIINNLNKNKNYLEDSLNYILEKSNNKNLLNKLEKNNTWEDYFKNISNYLEDIIFNKEDSFLIDKIKLLQNTIKIKQYIDKNKKNYSIPIRIKNKITSLNMFVQNNITKKDNIEIAMYVNIPSIGEIKSYIIKNNRNIYIKEDESSSHILKDNIKYLKKLFRSKDFNLEYADYYNLNNKLNNKLTSYDIKKEIFEISSIIKEFFNNI